MHDVVTQYILLLPCRWSIPVGCVSFIWLMFCVVIFMLPTVYPITAVTFNFAPAVLGTILLLAAGVWCLTARFWFAGPRTDVDNSDVVKVPYWISDPPDVVIDVQLGQISPSVVAHDCAAVFIVYVVPCPSCQLRCKALLVLHRWHTSGF